MKLKFAYGIVPWVLDTEKREGVRSGFGTANQPAAMPGQGEVFAVALADSTGINTDQMDMERIAVIAANYISERFDTIFSLDEAYTEKTVMEYLDEAAGLIAGNSDFSLNFVAVKEDRYLAGHIGTGLIGVQNRGPIPGQLQSCSILSKPDKGMTKLRVLKGDLQQVSGFLLMNMGACPSLFNGEEGSLSPACDTFMEWLKEYDEETVSEALAENIKKYFLKNTKSDIGVAVAVLDYSDARPVALEGEEEHSQNEEELHQDQEEVNASVEKSVLENIAEDNIEEDDKRKQGRKKLLSVVALIAVIAVLLFFWMNLTEKVKPNQEGGSGNPPAADYGEDESKLGQDEKPAAEINLDEVNPADHEPSVTFAVDSPVSYNSGEYVGGRDVPAGEYFFWTGAMLAPDSIIINDDTCLSDELYCMTVELKEGDRMTAAYRFTSEENVNPVTAKDGILISGKYKIGKDISPGSYKIAPLDKDEPGRYYSVSDGEISNDTDVLKDMTVEVPENGYIVFYRSVLAVDRNE